MIKKVFPYFMAAAVSLSFAGCSQNEVSQDGDSLGEDKMVGIFAVICDDEGTPLTPTDFASDNALKFYRERVKYDDSSDQYYVTYIEGADVFSGKQIKEITGNNEGFEVQLNLVHTHELENTVMYLYSVLLDEENNSYYLSEERTAFSLDAMSGAALTQRLPATDAGGEGESPAYTCSVDINFVYTDYLSAVNILEFDAGNNLISSQERGEYQNYISGANCDYVIVEQIFEDYKSGEFYSRRTLINRSDEEDVRTLHLHYPRGDGFVRDDTLEVDFS